MKIRFFADGNTAVFKGKKQVSELGRSWFRCFIDFLESCGIEKEDISEIIMPDGKNAEIFDIGGGEYSWRIKL